MLYQNCLVYHIKLKNTTDSLVDYFDIYDILVLVYNSF